jgi:hypothetical protein
MTENAQTQTKEADSLSGVRVFAYPSDAKVISCVQDGVNVIGSALSEGANLVILPIDRLDPAFFQLRTGLVGEILQKFVNYQIRVAILGDVAHLTAESTALRDFVRECNRGSNVWILADRQALEQRLRA